MEIIDEINKSKKSLRINIDERMKINNNYVKEFLRTYLALVTGPDDKQKSIKARVSNSIVKSSFLFFYCLVRVQLYR